MPDPFTTLPLPLPVLILSSLNSLPTLHNVLLASPAAAYIFEENYAQITESIISKMPLTLRAFPRYICYIRSNTSSIRAQCPTWEAFDNWLNRDLFDPKKGGDKRIIKATTTLAVVKSLVQTACQIQERSTAFSRVHAKKMTDETARADTLWRIAIWINIRKIFAPREAGEACDGVKVLEQHLWISPVFIWQRARISHKSIRASGAALHNIKAFSRFRTDMMIEFLQKRELEKGRENGGQSKGLQQLPDVKISPVTSTPNPKSNH